MHEDWFPDLWSFHTKAFLQIEIPCWQATDQSLSLSKKDTGFTSLQLIPIDFLNSSRQFVGFYPRNVFDAHKLIIEAH